MEPLQPCPRDRKQSFATLREAATVARRSPRKTKRIVFAYHCKTCPYFHVRRTKIRDGRRVE